MKSKICMIRHGITEGNQRRLYYGHTDIPLAEAGVTELTKLAEQGLYPQSETADFYTTGLVRTEQTFGLIYGNREHGTIEELREINFGVFEMKSYDELKDIEEYQLWAEDRTKELPPPGGESIKAFYDRVMGGFALLKQKHALKELAMRHREEEAVSIIVCHGGTIAAILENLFPGEKEHFYQWIPNPGHGYLLTMEDGEVAAAEPF